MRPALIDHSTHNLGAPEGVSDEECGRLPVRVQVLEDQSILSHSAWKPNDQELALLNQGGYVILTVACWQVPVMLSVGNAKAATEL